jgi:hypothetical protein
MAISLVNFSGGSQQGGPFSTVVSAAQNVANGNTLVAGFRWLANTVTDNAGNTWQALPHLPGVPVSNLGEGFQFFWCNNCVGNSALVVTANLVSTSQAIDAYNAIGVWNIAGGPLVLDQYLIGTGTSGTTMTYGPFSTRYPNTIACLLGMSTSNLNTETVSAPLIQDGGTSIAGQQIAGAAHTIYTTMQSSQSLVMTTSVNGNWQIGGPVFGATQQIPPRYKHKAAIAAAPPMFTGRMYDYFITLEKLWPLS